MDTFGYFQSSGERVGSGVNRGEGAGDGSIASEGDGASGFQVSRDEKVIDGGDIVGVAGGRGAESAVSRATVSSDLESVAGEEVRGGGGALELSSALDGEEGGGGGGADADEASRINSHSLSIISSKGHIICAEMVQN